MEQTNPNYTFERVWAMFEETQKQMKETDRQIKERSRETDKKLRNLEKLFTGQWGKLMESLVEGDLIDLLKGRGISVNQTAQRIHKIYNGKEIEIDIVAKNGKEVVFVEVKTTLTVEDVNDFLEKMENLKTIFPEYKDNLVYGAMAYLRSESDAHIRAMRKGLFVIRATGKSATIINSSDFNPTNF